MIDKYLYLEGSFLYLLLSIDINYITMNYVLKA